MCLTITQNVTVKYGYVLMDNIGKFGELIVIYQPILILINLISQLSSFNFIA